MRTVTARLKRWSAILPICGLLYFALGTAHSIRFNREVHNNRPSRYFYWSIIRLDSDPLNRHPISTTVPCKNAPGDCASWDPGFIWIDPGWGTQIYFWAVIPALALTAASVRGFARLGVSEVKSFFVLMPILSSLWLFLVG